MAMQDIVKIHENDNVAVALRPLAKGETLDVVLAWGICKNISRDEIHHLVDEIYDKYTRGCMGTNDGQGTGEG